MRIVALAVAFCAMLLPAQTRSRGAHEHGAAKVTITFESTKGSPAGDIDFEAPAESVVGFEYQAKTPADKAKQTAALNTLKSRIGEMVIFPAAFGCKITPKSAEVKAEGSGHQHQEAKPVAKKAAPAAAKPATKKEEHSEVQAEFAVACAKPLAGAEIRFGFTKVFPKIHEVEVALLAGEQQAKAEVENDKGVLRIAK